MSASVTDLTANRHGLESLVGEGAARERLADDVELEIGAGVGHVNLRGNPADAGFRATVERVLGQPLPVEPNTTSRAAHTVCWLGPDEWLILADGEQAGRLAADLEAALGGKHAAVNDVSAGQVLLRLSGQGVRDLLSKGCTLDFHPRVFVPGACAQSGIAKATALFRCAASTDRFELVVRRSFADYLLRWLRHAA